jgi:hypothetical protein
MTHEQMLEEAARREKEQGDVKAQLEKTGIAYYGNVLILEEF